MEILLSIVGFMVVLIPLVILHELGHFIAARMAGITVLEFGIGIPPRAATLFTHQGTDYTLNWIPLGGFVRPYGEDFMSQKDEEGVSADLAEAQEKGIEKPKSVFDAGPWERLWFVFAGPLANFIVAYLLFVLVAFTGYPSDTVGIALVLDNSAADMAGLEEGDIVTHINEEEITSLNEFNGYMASDETLVMTVKHDNQPREVIFTPGRQSSETGLFELNVIKQPITRSGVLVWAVFEDTPAEAANLQAGDVMLSASIEGETRLFDDVDDMIDFIQPRADVAIDLTVQRGSEIFVKHIVPADVGGVGQIGVQIANGEINVGSGIVASDDPTRYRNLKKASSIGEALEVGADQYRNIFVALGDFVTEVRDGNIPLEQARPVSIIAIGKIAGQSLEASQRLNNPYPFLGLAAYISIALAITNLLPIPALDGGRILFIIVELLRGKPLPPEREGFVHLVGFGLLLLLMMFVVVLDIFYPVI